ncbi:uncharacterized protein V6R79_018849 [Siganus canaliculatus]
MNSLVGYGVSSESDSDGDVEGVDNREVNSATELCDGAAPARKTRNFLLEAGSGSSETEGESDPEEEDSSSTPPQQQIFASASQLTLPAPFVESLTPNKLPPPSLNACTDCSVFANPFKAQADQKLSALQKHVPLTMQARPSHIGGKRICVSYRKDGRCRFGIKCKFAHDSDLQTLNTPNEPLLSDESTASDQAESHTGASGDGRSQMIPQEAKEDDSGGQVKKRRVGLSNTLIPPKRAMKQYAMQRDRERVNMS